MPFFVLTGFVVVVGYSLLGATWFVLKTEGAIQVQMRRYALWLGRGTLHRQPDHSLSCPDHLGLHRLCVLDVPREDRSGRKFSLVFRLMDGNLPYNYLDPCGHDDPHCEPNFYGFGVTLQFARHYDMPFAIDHHTAL